MGVVRISFYALIACIMYQQGRQWFSPKLPTHYDGFTAPGWEKVATLFKKQLEDGTELGSAFNVYYKGEHVVSVWGGFADQEAMIPWRQDTLSIYCSTTKAIAALVIHMLVDRGLVDLQQPVAKYWPEFAQNGKDGITVAQLLSHQGGIAYVDDIFSFYEIKTNPEKVGRALARQVPIWKPGTAHGYHAITLGLLVDQLVRRLDPDHRGLSEFFQEEVAEPLDIEFYIGLPLEENYHTARTYAAGLGWDLLVASQYWPVVYGVAMSSDGMIGKMITNPPELKYLNSLLNNPHFREVPLGSLNGFGTGQSIAKLMGILANGGEVNGHRLMSSSGIVSLKTPIVSGIDQVMLNNCTYGPGTLLLTSPDGSYALGHPGRGGQLGYADPSRQLGWSYLTNHFTIYDAGDRPSTQELVQVMYDCAKALGPH